MDAVPIRLTQEFAAYATALRRCGVLAALDPVQMTSPAARIWEGSHSIKTKNGTVIRPWDIS